MDEAEFETAMQAIYSSLLANQQSLGKEFEEVVYDNLEELYEE